jgi:hypothetical protein
VSQRKLTVPDRPRFDVTLTPRSAAAFAVVTVLAAAGPLTGVAAAAPATDSAAKTCQRFDDEDYSTTLQAYRVSTSSPWNARRGNALGPIVVRRSDRRLLLCTSTSVGPFGADGTISAINPRIRLAAGERLSAATIADPWIAWTTTRAGRVTLHRKTVDSKAAPWTRRIASSPSTLLVTVDGTVVVRRRTTDPVISYPRGRAARSLPRVAKALRRTKRSALTQWGTRQIAVLGSHLAHPFFPATGTPVSRCTPAAPGDTVTRAGTHLVRLAGGTTWAQHSDSTKYQLTLCTTSGRRLLSRLLHDDGDYYDTASYAVGLAGPVLAVNLELFSGFSSSAEATTRRYAYVIGRDGAVTEHAVSIVVASPAAAAFVERGRLWLADADGLRQIPFAGSLTVSNTRLDLRPEGLLVRTPRRTVTLPVHPLPAGRFAAPTGPGVGGVPLASADLCGVFSTERGQYCDSVPSVQETPNG